MTEEKPWVYVLLGAAGSGRREVLADLLESGLAEGERPWVLLPATEPARPEDTRLGATGRWRWEEETIVAEIPAGVTHVFLLADGRGNPVDLLVKLGDWLAGAGVQLGRIVTVVHCRLAERRAELAPWFAACVHFSDVVLLNRREQVANKWLSDFQGQFKKQFFPALFELVKAGRVKNPLEILDPQARRVSHLFDVDDWTGLDLEGVEFGESGDDEDDEELDDDTPAPRAQVPGAQERPTAPDPDEWRPEIDPYLQLDAAGRRKKAIPDIGAVLDAEAAWLTTQ